MYLTSAQYATITGDTAPTDFTVCLSLAETLFDLHTLDYFSQLGEAALAALPTVVLSRIQKCVAYQVQAISGAGGISGATENDPQSVSLGKFSYTNWQKSNGNSLCSPSASLIPYLLSYIRGVE